MNLNRIEAFKKFEKQISEHPDQLSSKILDRINYLKQNLLPRDEYVETLEEPNKSYIKRILGERDMMNRIHHVCKDEDISRVLGEEYLCMNVFKSWDDDQKKENLKGIHERFKEIYEQNVDKIAACRDELGLPNPFSEFKPYSVPSE